MCRQSLHRQAIVLNSTLNLPRSTLPHQLLRSNATKYLKRCTDNLYNWQRARPSQAGSDEFILHDGPPYANGRLHAGHALNKITKDIICRFQLLQGKKVNYIPGWDCHGLPIEVKALQRLQEQSKGTDTRLGPVEIRKLARELAEETVRDQMQGFRQWAIMGDWERAYKSLDTDFVLRQLRQFKELVDKGECVSMGMNVALKTVAFLTDSSAGLIYRQYKPVYWSASSGTALAEAELEYDENHLSTAAFVKFPLIRVPGFLRQLLPETDIALSAVVWTTTPWTLPANKAIAVHNNLQYSLIEEPGSFGKRLLLVSKPLIKKIQEILCAGPLKTIVDSIQGSELLGSTEYVNVFQGIKGRPQPFIHADFVSDSSGSGLVHVAPGHGMDDYKICCDLGISLFSPVNDQSRFTTDACPDSPELLAGLDVLPGGVQAVLDILSSPPAWLNRHGSLLLATHDFIHKYPIDWRSKKPVIVRATEQWFADLGAIRADVTAALETARFIPESCESRLRSSVLGRTEWCISRQRAWGVPIPALYRKSESGKWDAVMTSSSIAHIIRVIEERGIDAWWTDPEDDKAWVSPELSHNAYVRGKDTLDVWFDSGTSWTLFTKERDDGHVADIYLEGTDQHRGWFQSSLLTYVAHQSNPQHAKTSNPIKAPYRTLITHGFVLDGKGLKMSKSLGNVITPDQIILGKLAQPHFPKESHSTKNTNQAATSPQHRNTISNRDTFNSDVLRLWVASCDYTKDVLVRDDVVKSVHGNMRKLRATFKWLLGVLNNFEPPLITSSPATSFKAARSYFADTLALHRLGLTAHAVHSSYSSYNHARAIAAINNFVNYDLSAFYFETAKDRLYTASLMERGSAQSTLLVIFDQLLRMVGPVTPLLVEEVVAHTPLPLIEMLSHQQASGEAEAPWHPLRSVWLPYKLYSPGSLQSQRLSRHFAVVKGVRAAVHAAQDMARTKGKIGSGLETVTQILLPETTLNDSKIGELFTQIEEDEWANLLVVSDTEIHRVTAQYISEADATSTFPDKGDGVGNERQDPQAWSFRAPIYMRDSSLCDYRDGGDKEQRSIGVAVVRPSRDHKCPRCWRWVALESDRVCGRCEDVLKEMGINSVLP